MRLFLKKESTKPFADFLKEKKQNSASDFSYSLPDWEEEAAGLLEVRLAGKLKGGADYLSLIERVRFVKTKILWDRLADRWWLFTGFALAVAFLLLILWLKLPILTGQMDLSHYSLPQPQLLSLSGRRFRLSPGQMIVSPETSLPHGYFIGRREHTPTGEVAVKPLYCEYKGIRRLKGKAKWILRIFFFAIFVVGAILSLRYDMRLGICFFSIIGTLIWLWGFFWKKLETSSAAEINPGAPQIIGDWTVTYRQ
jgi:hypothetical protein